MQLFYQANYLKQTSNEHSKAMKERYTSDGAPLVINQQRLPFTNFSTRSATIQRERR